MKKILLIFLFLYSFNVNADPAGVNNEWYLIKETIKDSLKESKLNLELFIEDKSLILKSKKEKVFIYNLGVKNHDVYLVKENINSLIYIFNSEDKKLYKSSLDDINFQELDWKFNSLMSIIKACDIEKYYLDFPSRKPEPAILPEEIRLSLSIQPQEVFKSRDYMLVYEKEEEIRNIKINRHFFDQINLGYGGVIVTAKGNSVDFVSRFFTPKATILEDPVTGSAHCTLIPFWSSRLLKKNLEALQISNRGGRLLCSDISERVIIGGQATLFSIGEFSL